MRVRERYPPFHKKKKGSQCPGSKVRTKADNPLAYDLGRCWRLYRDVLSASMLRILRIIFKWKREQRLRLVRTGDQNLYWIDIMLLEFHKPSYACALQTPEHFSVLTVFSDWSFQIKLFSLPEAIWTGKVDTNGDSQRERFPIYPDTDLLFWSLLPPIQTCSAGSCSIYIRMLLRRRIDGLSRLFEAYVTMRFDLIDMPVTISHFM